MCVKIVLATDMNVEAGSYAITESKMNIYSLTEASNNYKGKAHCDK